MITVPQQLTRLTENSNKHVQEGAKILSSLFNRHRKEGIAISREHQQKLAIVLNSIEAEEQVTETTASFPGHHILFDCMNRAVKKMRHESIHPYQVVDDIRNFIKEGDGENLRLHTFVTMFLTYAYMRIQSVGVVY